jgi:hypothetical protein
MLNSDIALKCFVYAKNTLSNYDSFPNYSRLHGHCTITYTHLEDKRTKVTYSTEKKASEKSHTYTKAIYKLNAN